MSDEMKGFEELELLDLRRCNTVGDIVTAMSKCSFGARMLGEVSNTLAEMVERGDIPVIVYDGKPNTPLDGLLKEMVVRGWAEEVLSPWAYSNGLGSGKNVLVVGRFPEGDEDALFNRPERAIFVNQFDLAKPGQVKDGFFPDVVFSDPRYVIPIIFASLEDRLTGSRTTVTQLMNRLPNHGGLANQVAEGADTVLAMVEDPDATVFLTLSGAMTIAKMGLVLCDMVDEGMVDLISSTGALMAHGLVESVGLKHYKHDPRHDDVRLAELKLNRITDTLEPETNLNQVARVISEVLEQVDGSTPISPSIFNRLIGEYLARRFPRERGILKSAYERKVPVLVPAFTDSEVGNDVYTHNVNRGRQGRPRILMDMELDSRLLMDIMLAAKNPRIFTVGGGVPRNNTQNVAPLIEITSERCGLDLPTRMFASGTRIAPDSPHFGHLSGCTYNENMSWRKMDPRGRFTEVRGDATIILPFIVKYIMEKRAA
ncbi:MAG: deoxyhypusine synthase family protein [Candidatus Woesearchaeota archaeon]|nr:MAG: deoxyhypusine synthase family protein [Candidatus Woesearchaeota archaeon]